MKKKYQVFVSSTYDDLVEERKTVSQALLETNCFPAGMELFPASSLEQWELIKKVIDDSDYYLVIIAGRYGTLCANSADQLSKRISYTEMEFKYALDTKKPIIAFIHRDPDSLAGKNCEKTKIGRLRLEKFRNLAKTGRVVKFWSNKDELKSQVVLSMPQLITSVPAKGWERSKKISALEEAASLLHADFFTGKWKSTTFKDGKYSVIDKTDIVDLVYDSYTGAISGKIKRLLPEDQNTRLWKCSGRVLGESIVLLYYSSKMQSLGCGLLRHYKNLLYRGYYLRYNYGTKAIDCISMTMQKDDGDQLNEYR